LCASIFFNRSRFDALHAGGLTELVGREEELELLLRRWSKAKTGEGQVVLLSGEAGIGKSRLTAALMEAGEPHTRLRYFCSPQHTDSRLLSDHQPDGAGCGVHARQRIPPHATYLFKHALVQDAAYGTLLREPRRAHRTRCSLGPLCATGRLRPSLKSKGRLRRKSGRRVG
jgi:AAA ATPase domain